MIQTHDNTGFWISMRKIRVAPSTCLCSTRTLNLYIMDRSKKNSQKRMSLFSDSILEHIPDRRSLCLNSIRITTK
ncbi:hypothetical protein ACET3Z_025718 [Daucus carota]